MKRIVTLFGVAVMAVFAFSAIAAGSALAEEKTKILPEPTAEKPLTATTNQKEKGHLLTVGGLEVKCEKSLGSASFTTANSGKGEVLFTECKGPLSTVCTGEGDAEGLIAAKGEVLFWLALLMTGTTSELVGALVFLISPEVKFVCVNKAKTIEDKIAVTGCVASQVLPASLNALIKEAKEEFAESSSGETKVLSVLPKETTKEIPCLPTTSVNGGAAELSAITGAFLVEKFKKGGAEITIELMNP